MDGAPQPCVQKVQRMLLAVTHSAEEDDGAHQVALRMHRCVACTVGIQTRGREDDGVQQDDLHSTQIGCHRS